MYPEIRDNSTCARRPIDGGIELDVLVAHSAALQLYEKRLPIVAWKGDSDGLVSYGGWASHQHSKPSV